MRFRALVILTASTALLHPFALTAQEMDVPVAIQVSILLKVISFDRQLHVRAPREMVVGVVFQSGSRTSVNAKDEVMQVMQALQSAKGTVDGLPIRAVAIDLDKENLAELSRSRVMTHLYVTPLRAMDVRTIAALAREMHLATMTGVARYLVDGLGLGVGLRAGRPRILVNLEASRLEGVELSAEVLKLAELVP
jgi:hypothetical protein